jgi:hypothetical protein
MSMKRTRAKTYGSSRRGEDGTISFGKSAQAAEKSWDDYVSGQGDEAFLPYSMKSKFEQGALINHPKFGKGVVLGVEEQRMDVLFAEGKKKLGHGLT